MDQETLEDWLRKATRKSTARLDEDRVFTLARDLLRELAAAHAETPPRHPSLEPADVVMEGGAPKLGGGAAGDAAEDIFRLGALIASLALNRPPAVSWRLDGPPRAELGSVRKRAALAGLAAPRSADRFATAREALAAVEAALVPEASAGASWPMFRGDAARTGARAGPSSAARIETRWQARVGAIASSPVIAGAVVIAATADGRLVFVDRASGRLLETVAAGTASESSPAAAGGIVHLGTDDGTLVGIGIDDARERYRAKLGSMVRSSPAGIGGTVVVGAIDAKGQGAVVAVGEDGTPRWTRRTPAVFSSPADAGGAVIVGADDGAVHALDAAKGAPRWSQRIGTKVRATPAVSEGVAHVASLDGMVAALAVADGARRWERALGHPVYSSPCLAGGLVVLGCHEGHVHGLDRATGEPRFQAETRGPVLSSPIAVGARVVVASTDGFLYLLDGTGAVLHRLALPGGATQSSPASDADEVFIGGTEGLHALVLRG